MNRYKQSAGALTLLAAFVFGGAVSAEAQRQNTREVRDAVRSLNSKIEDFEMTIRFQLESSSASPERVSDVTDDIRILRDSVSDFEDNIDRKRENKDDVSRMVDAAKRIDQFLFEYPQNKVVQNHWDGVRAQIDRIGSNYAVNANWDNELEPPWVKDDNEPVQKRPVAQNTVAVGLSGTYELDAARSENIDDIISDASLGNEDREDLKDKLAAPQQITLDIRGNQVTLGTSNAAPITITADGREKTENAAGRTIKVRATLAGDVLTVSSIGGETDYVITFTSLSNGRVLKVSRRITTDYLSETVIAESVYNKTDVSSSQIANGNISPSANADPGGSYSDNDQPAGTVNPNGSPSIGTASTGSYAVPGGVTMTGVLENEINTRASHNNDRFKLTVQSPSEYRGAVIDGYISGVGRSGKVTGESNVTFNFEKITLRDGRSFDFAGTLQGIRNANGKAVRIDNEGTAKGGSQTRQTIKRSSVGAGIGALIGAIAGGGKGAAIGAVIGGGAGAGSVIVQGPDDIRLMPGSTITLQSSSPTARNYPR